MLGERSQIKKAAYCMIPSLEHSRKGKAPKHREGVEQHVGIWELMEYLYLDFVVVIT